MWSRICPYVSSTQLLEYIVAFEVLAGVTEEYVFRVVALCNSGKARRLGVTYRLHVQVGRIIIIINNKPTRSKRKVELLKNEIKRIIY